LLDVAVLKYVDLEEKLDASVHYRKIDEISADDPGSGADQQSPVRLLADSDSN
jgi:hypothetical protein